MDLTSYYSRRPDYLFANFREMFDALTDRSPGSAAFRMKLAGSEEYTTWTYGDLRAETARISLWLAENRFGKGDTIALISENRPEWVMVYYAVTISGMIIVPLDSTLDAKQVANTLKTSKAKAIFHSAAHAVKVAEALAGEPSVARVDFDGSGGSFDYRTIKNGEKTIVLPPAGTIRGDDVASIIFTSGTTGVAKGIQLTHSGILANTNAAIQALDPRPEDVFIAILPLHHTYATTCTMLSPLLAGGSITFVEKLIPTVILRHIRESGVTFVIGVPLLFDKIMNGIVGEIRKLPGGKGKTVLSLLKLCGNARTSLGVPLGRFLLGSLRKKAGLDTVRLVVSGGGPLAWETAFFYDAIGIDLVQGYGMSENGPLISVNPPRGKDNRSVGWPVKNTEARIADAGADGIGEIQVRSPSLMKGYLDNETATREMFTDDSWLKTGDLGRISEKGFIYITGRSKNLIVTEGGKNVYPEEIEERFSTVPFVKQVMVVGRKTGPGKSGEEVVAVFVPNRDWIKANHPGREEDMDFFKSLLRPEVIRINRNLAQYMKITESLVRETDMEITSTLKIKRYLYRKEYQERG